MSRYVGHKNQTLHHRQCILHHTALYYRQNHSQNSAQQALCSPPPHWVQCQPQPRWGWRQPAWCSAWSTCWCRGHTGTAPCAECPPADSASWTTGTHSHWKHQHSHTQLLSWQQLSLKTPHTWQLTALHNENSSHTHDCNSHWKHQHTYTHMTAIHTENISTHTHMTAIHT